MAQQHTPPPELRARWRQEAPRYRDGGVGREDWLIDSAAEWGADQQVETICKRLEYLGWHSAVQDIRAAYCTKPPSLKEEALATLQRISKDSYPCSYQDDGDWDTIRRALKSIPNPS
jgi:hypothetical protein